MSEDQTMSAEEFQNQYFNDESEGLDGEMEYDLETGLLGEHDEFANLHAELNEAREQLVSIRDFIRFSVTQLRNYDVVVAQGTTDEFAEASAIVLHSLSLDWSANEQILDCRLTTSEKQLVLGLLEERIAERKPLSYLINLSYFCDLPFYVDERVLIPRSPIAELIRQQFHPYFEVTELAKPLGVSPNEKSAVFYDHGLDVKQLSQPERILDLCTGSGCIAIALATRFVDALVDAVDIDKGALEVAMVNVDHHDLGHQVNVIESDLFAKIPAENQYELIVTNPPYVDAAIMADLPPEFLYEPEHALAAGQDGLDLVHRILFEAPDYLSPDGLLICEVGDSEWALKQAYPEIQFDWLKFAHGGHGVFAITYDELVSNRQLFASYVQLLDSLQ
ncbi:MULTISPECIES: 50S ribosomal protein L3 N(5)-glutamine methyltransferase [Psychrobacter]|jgi:ribosomal protein L3 glutamine methyltransferase|uniref:Ribosomal protein L3 N(5)-glutamine methyltransferase n=3 Tax=Psychrobacter TaxID=497 RepID=A0A6N7BXS6_9GAMM|nr:MULTISPECIES: 50S ribosomal protein L3 N(5)-glutamine methyltransferase [Psychrobacter]KAF0567783.1 Ribosomal protein L3 N(5)-glutamine methyltransferase [Psychrobacter nivimaris]MBA6243819.1 50S ribosomal protein L3 N(5)-glutamine methyltransferase [Psychrobacter sp. Urea-trap-18]MBA6285402.1 50S ribosomal protein L3 N(5)-glutamine methyltransferase [Psychrobacter sp. Urea-trap-16]MBA6319078.1 50S ribosomal protein L3 N(5)-glutamine methyltransferase [Psychrobacter sp. Urea-trap-20]MBA6335|tara:strand:- start:31 stop:1203 length:1173 start_codon:yes stop_codon:yes gene_type:complete